MKALLWTALLAAVPALAQPVGFGIKGGLPLQDAFNRTSSGGTQFVVGPMVELRLPLGIAIEADALYNRSNLKLADIVPSVRSGAYASNLEIPIVLKYKFATAPLLHPYVEAGPSFRKVFNVFSDLSGAQVETTGKGFVIGAGLEIHALLLRISPEIRYTHWGSQTFSYPNVTSLSFNQSQAQFLVGINF